MSKAIDDLIHEHEAIRFALRVLERMADLAEGGAAVDADDQARLIAFIQEFADKCHHGKEEGLLFPALEAAGVAREGGPVGAMLEEHEAGRAFVGRMEAAFRDGSRGRNFAAAARGYVELLRAHIEKENKVLFPMAERRLEPSILEELYSRFEDHERDVIGSGRHEELHAMLEDFERKYLGPA